MPDKKPNPDADFLEREKVMYVQSSNVAWLQFKNGTLFVGYKNGSRYYKEDVAPELALKVLKADSVGSALHGLQGTHGVFKKCES